MTRFNMCTEQMEFILNLIKEIKMAGSNLSTGGKEPQRSIITPYGLTACAQQAEQEYL